MMGNYHVRFLGGKGVVTPLTYPVRRIIVSAKSNLVRFEMDGACYATVQPIFWKYIDYSSFDKVIIHT